MAEKRLFDVDEIDYLLDEWRDGNGESDNFNRTKILNEINKIVRRNIKEFAAEIKSDMDHTGCLQYSAFIKSALEKRGIK